MDASSPKTVQVKRGGLHLKGNSGEVANCIFHSNSATSVGGGLHAESIDVKNCTFADNFSSVSGAALSGAGLVANSIIIGNGPSGSNPVSGITDGSMEKLISEKETGFEAQPAVEGFPGDPEARPAVDAVYEPAVYETVIGAPNLVDWNNSIGWEPFGGNVFVNPQTAMGEDGRWFTRYDGLVPSLNSKAIDAGKLAFVALDSLDVDEDSNKKESLPLDILGNSRKSGSYVDLGAYEAGSIVGNSLVRVGAVIPYEVPDYLITWNVSNKLEWNRESDLQINLGAWQHVTQSGFWNNVPHGREDIYDRDEKIARGIEVIKPSSWSRVDAGSRYSGVVWENSWDWINSKSGFSYDVVKTYLWNDSSLQVKITGLDENRNYSLKSSFNCPNMGK